MLGQVNRRLKDLKTVTEDSLNEEWHALNFERVTALVMTLSEAVDLLLEGLSHLRESSHSDRDPILPGLVLVATGFERLLKCALAFRLLRDTGSLPTRRDFGRHHHHRVLDHWKALKDSCPDASPAASRVLADAADERTDEHRVLEVVQSQAEPSGRYLGQEAYLGAKVEGVTPPVQLASGAMQRLYRVGRLRAFLDASLAGETNDPDFDAALQEEVDEISKMADAVACLFREGTLGELARDFSVIFPQGFPEAPDDDGQLMNPQGAESS